MTWGETQEVEAVAAAVRRVTWGETQEAVAEAPKAAEVRRATWVEKKRRCLAAAAPRRVGAETRGVRAGRVWP